MTKKTLLTTALALSLACALASCRGGEEPGTAVAGRKSPPFAGSTRERVPALVGRFALSGDPTSIPAPDPAQRKVNALYPTEGTSAQYDAAGGEKVALQVLNYPSPEDAEQARRFLAENHRSLGGAQVSERQVARGEGGAARTVLTVEDAGRNVHQAVWTESSLLYTVTAPTLDAATEFQQNFPF